MRTFADVSSDSAATNRFARSPRRTPAHAQAPAGIQPKLVVNAPGDVYEREADRVSEQVMRMPEPRAQRACACGGGCPACQSKPQGLEHGRLQTRRVGSSDIGQTAAPPIVHDVLRSPGQPLDAPTRLFMERRFDQDFSRVRVHADARAAESARAISARAYTVGQNVVFGPGQYAPETTRGRELLAHELTHVLQQGGSAATLQRARDDEAECPGYDGAAEINVSKTENGHLSIDVLTFPPGSDNLLVADFGVDWRHVKDSTRNDPILKANISVFEGDEDVEWSIAGYSDCVGNENDTFLRRGRARNVFELLKPATRARATFAAAPPGEFVTDNGSAAHRAMNRGVVIKRGRRGPAPRRPDTRPAQSCGPDATKWFLKQIDAAKKDAAVVQINSDMQIARSILAGLGISADLIALGRVAMLVADAQKSAGFPPFKGKAQEQLMNAFSGHLAIAQAEEKVKKMDAVELIRLKRAAELMQDAARMWKGLVQTGARYDFKNSSATLLNPRSETCPTDCAGTVTLCDLCLGKDVPGNLFYAHIGRFVGWMELTLQLGSQFAQLASTKDWDPPEDTAMIKLGFDLPDPLTESDLCAALRAGAGGVSHQCKACHEPLVADIV